MARFAALLVVLLTSLCHSTSAFAERRVALVIANADYGSISLGNPKNDATDISNLLKSQLGFDTRLEFNLDKPLFERALAEFAETAAGADIAVIYYSGYSVEVEGSDYIMPATAEMSSDRKIRYEAIRLDDILAAVDSARVRIAVIDACRNTPFTGRNLAPGCGLARVSSKRLGRGTILSFSAKAGTIAEEGAGRNSPFAAALIKYLPEPGVDLQRLFRNVSAAVREATANRQEPYFVGDLPRDDVVLKPSTVRISKAQGASLKRLEELSYWETIKGENEVIYFQDFLAKFPDGVFASAARNKIQKLEVSLAGADQQQSSASLSGPLKATEQPGKRIALVIGNSAYQHTPALVNPKNDAADTSAVLRRLGFIVLSENDLTKQGMDQAFARFAREAKGAEATLFYYAGHAMQFEGVNYLMPVDAKLDDEAGVPFEMTRLDDVLSGMRSIGGVRMAILDACRNNPLEEGLKRSVSLTRNAELTRGLARIAKPEGLLIAYSTQPGHVAEDGRKRNSPFTSAFLKNVSTPGLEVGLLFRRITGDVRKATDGKQIPELSISLEGEFYFKPGE